MSKRDARNYIAIGLGKGGRGGPWGGFADAEDLNLVFDGPLGECHVCHVPLNRSQQPRQLRHTLGFLDWALRPILTDFDRF